MECMENLIFLLNKSQFGRSNESPWSHTLTLRGHEAFSNCFVVSGVVYTRINLISEAVVFFYVFKVSFFLQLNNLLVVILVSLVSSKYMNLKSYMGEAFGPLKVMIIPAMF